MGGLNSELRERIEALGEEEENGDADNIRGVQLPLLHRIEASLDVIAAEEELHEADLTLSPGVEGRNGGIVVALGGLNVGEESRRDLLGGHRVQR